MMSGPETTKRYTIQSAEYEGLTTGRTGDGRQVLMGIDGNQVLALYFDAGGKLEGFESRPIEAGASGGSLRPFTHEFQRAALELMRAWQASVACVSAPISIQRFTAAGVGVEDYPSYLERPMQVLAGTLAPTEGGNPSLIADAEDWERAGCFVLSWGKEFWMNADGTIGST